ncbi:hypothetical protein Bca52824_058066 [Brassica carinata]|uniref:Uncharacterized protein n=1 Tax=Brassica carinata TaxID=52824 RepID=A0A8X7UGT3_BRACI|nr:hypothetical protein Bca52824_058066 [Brassica carinata]
MWFQEELLNPREASMKKLEASLLSHPKITFMLELEGVSQQIATASLKECYYLQRTDLVRREKISEMLTLLQDLVPGSSESSFT